MDFSTTIYDSTQHDNFYPSASAGQGLSISELSNFVSQLLSTLEIDELSNLYFNQLSGLMPITGFSLSDFDSRWVFGNAPISAVLIELPLHTDTLTDSSSDEKHSAYYYMTRSLSLSQQKVLAQLHSIFNQQLAHALSFRRMRKMATKDMLTGLGNRSGFDEALTRQLGWAQRHEEAFALLIIDLDNFKQVNDNFGHREGDTVLVTVANQLLNVLRDEDEAFRFGGDEFCVVLDCQTQQQLACAASRIQLSINQSAYLSRMNVSCSLGGAVFREGDDLASIFDRADTALYKVKHSGKNSYQAA